MKDTLKQQDGLFLEVPVAEHGRSALISWLMLGVGSLLIGGILVLFFLLGLFPFAKSLFPDSLVFKRALVVHVALSTVIWCLAFFALLFALKPRLKGATLSMRLAPKLAWLAGLMMLLAIFIPDVEPFLSNYVPVLNHPFFLYALLLFGLALLLGFLDWRFPKGAKGESQSSESRAGSSYFVPEEAWSGLKLGALAFIMAMFAFAVSYLTLPVTETGASTPFTEDSYEKLMWGGGHVLQFVSAVMMLLSWQSILRPLLGPIFQAKTMALLYFILVAPTFVAPYMANLGHPYSHAFFTKIMQWGLFPVLSIFFLKALYLLLTLKAKPPTFWKDVRVRGFLMAFMLNTVGFLLGASIRGSNTVIPAHYHANLGAVTVTLMTLSYPLVSHLGYSWQGLKRPKWMARQVLFYGFGQVIFVAGLAIVGFLGAARKAYGSDLAPGSGTIFESIGQQLRGWGLLVAVLGGSIYSLLMLHAFFALKKKKSEES